MQRADDDLSRLMNDESRTLHLHGWRKPPGTPQATLLARLQPHLRPYRLRVDNDWTIRPDWEEHEA